MSELKIEIKTLNELLAKESLVIPSYQRPYSWTEKQLRPLLDDLYKRDKGQLLIMGGIILHKNNESEKENEKNIVDGQQRLISFTIIQYLINKEKAENENFTLLSNEFEHQESIANIVNNKLLVDEYIQKKGIPNIENIEFIVVETESIDDAFSFFDSQNTRGKPLEVYDVLKAHHLRFIKSNELATLCAKKWEYTEKDPQLGMTLLLDTLLARGRRWSYNHQNRPDLRVEYKSQRKEKKEANTYTLNRYQQVALFDTWKYNPAKKEVLELNFKEINATYKVGSIEINDNISHFFPFQITQTIEGGELFFWFTQKYHKLTKELFLEKNPNTSDNFENLVFALRDDFRWNIGANYVYDIYRGVLLFYFDKFGYEQLDDVAVSFFYSIYWLRFKQHTVQYASIYKYIREEFNPFALIKEASFPEFIINKCNEFLEGKYKDEISFEKGFRKDFRDAIILEKNSKFTILKTLDSETNKIFEKLKKNKENGNK